MKQVEERYISFEASKMAYRDIKNSVDTAKREGIAEGKEIGMKEGMEKGLAEGMEKGRAEGKHEANTETAQRLLAMGFSAEQVAKATQLPLEIIKNLSNSKNSSFACKLHTLQVSEHHGIPTCPRHQKSITSPHALS